MIHLIVCGATGRMGSLICELASASKDWKIAGQVDTKNPLDAIINQGEIIIDFSLPNGTEKHLKLAAQHKKPMVIGTTGFNPEQMNHLVETSKAVPIVYSPNMSAGINLMFQMIGMAAKTLGEDYAIEISETHHVHKKDQPSGTAKMMGTIVQETIGVKPPIQSAREGEVVGDHTIVFGSPSEHLAILHRALDRKVFAEGALRAAKWVLGKKPGLYSMAHVLGLEQK